MALLDDVKLHLDIIGSDKQIDKKVMQIIARAKSYLRRFKPTLNDSDFENDKNPVHSMLLDYCRYDFSNASEAYKENYRDQLLELRDHYNVEVCSDEEISD